MDAGPSSNSLTDHGSSRTRPSAGCGEGCGRSPPWAVRGRPPLPRHGQLERAEVRADRQLADDQAIASRGRTGLRVFFRTLNAVSFPREERFDSVAFRAGRETTVGGHFLPPLGHTNLSGREPAGQCFRSLRERFHFSSANRTLSPARSSAIRSRSA